MSTPTNARRGERNGSAKLKECDVADIRSDDRHLKVVAHEYGVSMNSISQIRRGKRWAHI